MSAPAVAVRERPILFSGDMVRAILDGRETQTRRVMKPQPDGSLDHNPRKIDRFRDVGVTVRTGRCTFEAGDRDGPIDAFGAGVGSIKANIECPYGQPGDTLYVRETWASLLFERDWETGLIDGWSPAGEAGRGTIVYRADSYFDDAGNTVEDRGFAWRSPASMPRWASRITLEVAGVRVERVQDWDWINSDRGYPWGSNPWVWVVDFRVLSPATAQEPAPVRERGGQ